MKVEIFHIKFPCCTGTDSNMFDVSATEDSWDRDSARLLTHSIGSTFTAFSLGVR